MFEGAGDFCVIPSFAVIPAFSSQVGMMTGGIPGFSIDVTKVTSKTKHYSLSHKSSLADGLEPILSSWDSRNTSGIQTIYNDRIQSLVSNYNTVYVTLRITPSVKL